MHGGQVHNTRQQYSAETEATLALHANTFAEKHALSSDHRLPCIVLSLDIAKEQQQC